MKELLLKRRQITVVFETNENWDQDMLAIPLAEFAKLVGEAELTFSLDDTTDANFTSDYLTHLIVRDLEGEDEKDIVAFRFDAVGDIEETIEGGPFHPAI